MGYEDGSFILLCFNFTLCVCVENFHIMCRAVLVVPHSTHSSTGQEEANWPNRLGHIFICLYGNGRLNWFDNSSIIQQLYWSLVKFHNLCKPKFTAELTWASWHVIKDMLDVTYGNNNLLLMCMLHAKIWTCKNFPLHSINLWLTTDMAKMTVACIFACNFGLIATLNTRIVLRFALCNTLTHC